jgi:hypothetical protein
MEKVSARSKALGEIDEYSVHSPRFRIRVVLPIKLGEAVLVLEAPELLLERDRVGRAEEGKRSVMSRGGGERRGRTGPC